MQSCVMYPKEAILICRPALRKACGENRHAAKLLSYLLFRASLCQEVKQEVEPLNAVPRSQGRAVLQERAITIYRTQGQIVREMDGELCARTLRDEAIPCLVELGYLTCQQIKGDKQSTAYTIHPDVIQQGLDHPECIPSFKTMPFYQRILTARARKKLRPEIVPDGAEKSGPFGVFSEWSGVFSGRFGVFSASLRKKLRTGNAISARITGGFRGSFCSP